MAGRRKYISGHCASGARGGHQRCRYIITDKMKCACPCGHTDQQMGCGGGHSPPPRPIVGQLDLFNEEPGR